MKKSETFSTSFFIGRPIVWIPNIFKGYGWIEGWGGLTGCVVDTP